MRSLSLQISTWSRRAAVGALASPALVAPAMAASAAMAGTGIEGSKITQIHPDP